jgi:hypothetical protein
VTDFSQLPPADQEAIGKTLQDGSWLIVSEMFQDANTETTYRHEVHKIPA